MFSFHFFSELCHFFIHIFIFSRYLSLRFDLVFVEQTLLNVTFFLIVMKYVV